MAKEKKQDGGWQFPKALEIVKCKVTPTKEEIYIAEEPRAFVDALTKPPLQFSAMDCPRCGCQIALAVRFPRVDLPEVTERDGADESEVAEGED